MLGRESHTTSLAIKVSKDSTGPGESEGCWKGRCLLKGTAFKLFHASTHPGLWQRMVALRVLKQTGRDWNCVALRKGLEQQCPCTEFLSVTTYGSHLSLVEHSLHMASTCSHTDYSQRPHHRKLARSSGLCQWLPAWVHVAFFS